MIARLAALCAALLLSACARAPAPDPHVALWALGDPAHPAGWILGTIHALPRDVRWRRPAIDTAIAGADRLVLEIGEPLDATAAGRVLAQMGFARGLPPPSQRLHGRDAMALGAAYRALGLNDARFADEKSWGVALQIAALASQRAGADPDLGVEPQLRAAMPHTPVSGLETIASQFAAFDHLSARAQDVLLADVAREAIDQGASDRDVLALWLNGDVEGLAREANRDFLANRELHEALLTARNRAWVGIVTGLLAQHAHPLIAVGAAHLAGSNSLPALLAAQGIRVTRID